MDENALPPAGKADPGTATWQPEAIALHQASISSFLDAQFAFPWVRLAAERTLELLDLSLGHSVLDVGCGNGTFLALLGRVVGAQGRAVGVEYAPAFVAEARSRIASEGLDDCVTVVEGNAYGLPFDDNSFDAARCERVLMHLDDPVAAIREMHRVVRPGGRVVVTEPDWAGLLMDHPDPDALTLLYNSFLTRFRQPRMGRSLYRHFAEAGLVDRDVTLIPAVLTNVDVFQQSGLDLSSQVEEIVAAGTLSRERAEAAATYFESANDDGMFFSAGTYFIASGSVPAV
jgi:ubiquinone/menaquinone biosynthesis C-methylase UbiE